MELTLRWPGRSGTLTLPENGWRSHGKSSEQHAFLTDPRAPPPLHEVFVKRYHRRPAPAHDLLLRLLRDGNAGPALPRFLGYANGGGWHYYAFARLPSCCLLSTVTGNGKVPHGKTLTPALLVAVLNASLRAFVFFHNEGYYYADYAFENMLFQPQRNAVVLIDADSAFPRGIRATAADCRQTWWTLFTAAGLSRLEYLNATMLMSMAMVLAVALADLSRRGPDANVAGLLRARPDAQRQYFDALRAGDTRTVARLFAPPASRGAADGRLAVQAGALCADWNRRLDAMRRDEPVAWSALPGLILLLLNLADPGRRYGSSRPSSLPPRPGGTAAPPPAAPVVPPPPKQKKQQVRSPAGPASPLAAPAAPPPKQTKRRQAPRPAKPPPPPAAFAAPPPKQQQARSLAGRDWSARLSRRVKRMPPYNDLAFAATCLVVLVVLFRLMWPSL